MVKDTEIYKPPLTPLPRREALLFHAGGLGLSGFFGLLAAAAVDSAGLAEAEH